MAVFSLMLNFPQYPISPHFFQPSQPSQPSQSSQKKNLLSLPFTKDIPTLYEERRKVGELAQPSM